MTGNSYTIWKWSRMLYPVHDNTQKSILCSIGPWTNIVHIYGTPSQSKVDWLDSGCKRFIILQHGPLVQPY